MVCHGRPESVAFFRCGTVGRLADGLDSQPVPQPVSEGSVRTGEHGIGLLVPGTSGIPLCRPDDWRYADERQAEWTHSFQSGLFCLSADTHRSLDIADHAIVAVSFVPYL